MTNGERGGDDVRRGVALTSKVIAEVEELHERTAQLERDFGGLRGRKARHALRGAREAESDLLRVLGFDSYPQFVTVVRSLAIPIREGVADVSLDELEDDSYVRDAQQTEADLLRVLRGLNSGGTERGAEGGAEQGEVVDVTVPPPAPSPAIVVVDDDGDSDDVHARVAAFEEELAQTRFELREVREELRSRGEAAEVDGVGAVVQAASAGLVQAAQELRELAELLRAERSELASIAARARSEAEEILALAQVDAQRIRDDAAAEASVVLDEARAAAIALTRDAIVTIDGLRRLAAEDAGPPIS